MARKRKQKVKFSRTAIKAILVIVLIVALALGAWYLIDKPSFESTLDKVVALLNPKAPALEGGGTEGNPTGDLLKIHFVDVGQGDAIYIQFPDGKDMLIDAGDKKSENTESLLTYLDDYGSVQNGIDYLMLTHVDADHVGGMDNVLETYSISTIYMPNIGIVESDPELGYWGNASQAYEDFYGLAKSEGAEIIYNQGQHKIEGTNYKIDIYCPDESYYENFVGEISDGPTKNDMSPVCVIEYAGVRTLLSGDLNDETSKEEYAWSEELFIEKTGLSLMDCNVIKAGHHGSKGSTSKALLEFTKPEHIIISVGEGNSYEHPNTALLDRINEYNSELMDNIYRTDEKGHILMNIGANGEYNFQWEKSA